MNRNRPIAPLSVVFLVFSMIIASTGHWRGGLDLFGATMIGSGIARLVLSRDQAGALAVRHRIFDAGLLIGSGVAIVLLVAVVPIPTQ